MLAVSCALEHMTYDFEIDLLLLIYLSFSLSRALMPQLPQAVISRVTWTSDVYEPSDVSLAAATHSSCSSSKARQLQPCSLQAL
jgi:hypothetical protein